MRIPGAHAGPMDAAASAATSSAFRPAWWLRNARRARPSSCCCPIPHLSSISPLSPAAFSTSIPQTTSFSILPARPASAGVADVVAALAGIGRGAEQRAAHAGGRPVRPPGDGLGEGRGRTGCVQQERRTERGPGQGLRPRRPGFKGVFAVIVRRAPGNVWDVEHTADGRIRRIKRKVPRPWVNHYAFHMPGHDPRGCRAARPTPPAGPPRRSPRRRHRHQPSSCPCRDAGPPRALPEPGGIHVLGARHQGRPAPQGRTVFGESRSLRPQEVPLQGIGRQDPAFTPIPRGPLGSSRDGRPAPAPRQGRLAAPRGGSHVPQRPQAPYQQRPGPTLRRC